MEKKKRKLKLNARRVIVLIVLALIIFLILFGMFKLVSSIFAKEKIAGNLANGGRVVQDGNTVYYNKNEVGIIKEKGGEIYQITDGLAYSMTLVEDTIYYLTVSTTNTIDLMSVKTNGDELKKIKTLPTSIEKFYIEDSYVYYAIYSNVIGINKLSLETGEDVTLIAANIKDFVLDSGTIYYTDNVGYLHSVNTSGTDKKEIATGQNIGKIQILKNWIYFYDKTEDALCKIKKDGSSKQVVSAFVKNDVFNVTNKYVYYLDKQNKQISRSDLKGDKSKAIVSLNTSISKINISDGILYYLDTDTSNQYGERIYRVKTNGKATNPIEY